MNLHGKRHTTESLINIWRLHLEGWNTAQIGKKLGIQAWYPLYVLTKALTGKSRPKFRTYKDAVRLIRRQETVGGGVETVPNNQYVRIAGAVIGMEKQREERELSSPDQKLNNAFENLKSAVSDFIVSEVAIQAEGVKEELKVERELNRVLEEKFATLKNANWVTELRKKLANGGTQSDK
jgi:hypothetical protein